MRPSPKRLTTQFLQVDLCELRRNGWLLPSIACRRGNTVAISWRGTVSNVHLVSTAMHLGGRREWFKCPACNRRVRILYGPDFACRTCCRLNYPSTRQCTRDRAIARAVRLRRSLGGDGSLLEPFPGRSKGMKRKTWWRLFAKANRDEQRGIIGMAATVAGLTLRLDGRAGPRFRPPSNPLYRGG
jgi:hypothetical protein